MTESHQGRGGRRRRDDRDSLSSSSADLALGDEEEAIPLFNHRASQDAPGSVVVSGSGGRLFRRNTSTSGALPEEIVSLRVDARVAAGGGNSCLDGGGDSCAGVTEIHADPLTASAAAAASAAASATGLDDDDDEDEEEAAKAVDIISTSSQEESDHPELMSSSETLELRSGVTTTTTTIRMRPPPTTTTTTTTPSFMAGGGAGGKKDAAEHARTFCSSSGSRNSSSLGGQFRVLHREPRKVDKAKKFVLERAKRVCSKSFLHKLLPCIGFAKNYTLHHFVSDVIAGITLALTVIPTAIGYAALAELPLQYGLYASIVPGFVYAVLGTCKEVTIGATAVNALMSYNYAGPNNPQAALTLAFFSGLIEMCAGLLDLGFLTNFISAPIIAAFISAVSINVMTSQIKGLLGLNQIAGRGFRQTWVAVFRNIRQIRPVDASIGFGSLGVILLLRNMRNFTFGEGSDPSSWRARIVKKFKWFVQVSRNSLVLLLTSGLAYAMVNVWGMEAENVPRTTGTLQAGIPAWNLPWKFGLNESSSMDYKGPLEHAEDLGVGLVMLPLVSMIQIIAIVHNFTPPTKKVDSSQEFLALGICQLVGSFAGSLPVTASFGRSTVNWSSGVQTPFGGLVTGLLVIAATSFLTPHFAYIPTAALAAVIISSVVLTIDIDILIPIWKSKRIDLIPYLATFLVGILWRVEWGMILGTLTHLCILLYPTSQPDILVQMEKMDGIEFVLVQPDRSLNFPSVDRIRIRIKEASSIKVGHIGQLLTADDDIESNVVTSSPAARETMTKKSAASVLQPLPIVFDLSRVLDMDYSSAMAVRVLAKSVGGGATKQTGVTFCGANKCVEDVLQGVDPKLFISYANVEEAVRSMLTTRPSTPPPPTTTS